MRQSLQRVMLAWGLLVALSFAAPDIAAAEKTPAIAPQAIKVLRAMSDYLKKARAYSFRWEVSYDHVYDVAGVVEKLTYLRSGKVVVRRPDRFLVKAMEGARRQEFYYDGKNFWLFDPNLKLYATTKAPRTIDAALDNLRSRYGLDVPIAELMRNDLYSVLTQRIVGGAYMGLTRVRGRKAHHLAFARGDIDIQIWIAAGNKPLPLMIVGTMRNEKLWPQYRAWLVDWKFGQTVLERTFSFQPPKDAAKIEFLKPGAAADKEKSK